MKNTIFLIAVIILVSAFQQNKPADRFKTEKGMIKITVLYPAGDGKTFDWEYYASKHVPLIRSLLKDAVKGITFEKGISGRTPDSPAPYVAMFHMYFESMTAYRNSFGPNAPKITGDVPNYTNIQPIVVISEVQE